jgi:transcription termination factor Rho
MSVEPQALERSVLEAKERDELAVIAEALGLKPSPRASKATLIDQILVGIGVEEPKPRRRGRKRADDNGVEGDAEAGAGATEASEVGAVAAGDGVPTRAVAGHEPSSPPVAGPEPGVEAAAGAPTPAEAGGTSPAAGGGTGSADRPPEAAAQPDVRAVEPAEATPAVVPPAEAGGGAAAPATAAGAEGAPAGAAVQAAAGVPQAPAPEAPAPKPAPQPAPAPQPPRQQQPQPQQRQQPRASEPEPGNRRSRRRRGRDRGRERDLAGQEAAETVPYTGELIDVEGLLDLRDEGYGFVRTNGYLPGPNDAYVSVSQVRRFALRKGDYIKGAMRPANPQEKYPALVRIDEVSGLDPETARNRPRFENLTPLFPDERLRLEIPGEPHNVTARIIDLISPIGKGQRGLIVSPPKAGKTTIMKQIARSIETNNPEVYLMVLLIDERPEEVTDMRRWVQRGEVIASTFDRPSDEHTQVAELAIERAKRLVELGKDVVIILDGITRLARAYNLAAPATGRIMSGGVDSGALYPPKKFFGAARNIEEGGSLTILATALIETGSRMDEVIFEEFKGTGNMELRLDRKLAERRIYPAIDVNASSTRHEELLFDRKQLEMVWRLRRVLNGLAEGGSIAAGLELLIDKIKTTRSNDEFLAEIAKAPAPASV